MPAVQTAGMTARVLEALADAGVITPEQVATIESQSNRAGAGMGRDVVARGLATEADVEAVLEDALGVPRVDLQSYAPDEEALRLVPADLARETGVLPLFEIEGILTVAVGRARDVFLLDGMGAGLGLEVEAVLADPEALQRALDQYYPARASAPAASAGPSSAQEEAVQQADEPTASEYVADPEHAVHEDVTPDVAATGAEALDAALAGESAPINAGTAVEFHSEFEADVPVGVGAPSPFDLDVLAVADPARTMLLVTEIFERAVLVGASNVHIAPDRDQFSVAFRVGGELEVVATAPLSLQSPLIDGVRAFMGLQKPSLGQPLIGQLRRELAGNRVTLSLSAVKTTAGWRLVVSMGDDDRSVAALSELGLAEEDAQALDDIVGHGSGLVVVAAPIGEGASDTYRAVLAHAVACGRAAFSVEASASRPVPGVAQVGVPAGSPVAAAAFLSAGLGQDTDVIAIDPLETASELRIAIEAAVAGRLVVATVAAPSVAKALRRILEIGVDSTSLASALTAVVAQRVVGSEHRFEMLRVGESVRIAIEADDMGTVETGRAPARAE